MKLNQIILVAIFLIVEARAYQYPIHNNLPIRNRRLTTSEHSSKSELFVQPATFSSQVPSRRIDLGYENEHQQLHNLHQVVDTVTQLLNEEDEQLRGTQQNNANLDSGSSSNSQGHNQSPGSEILSESAIRHAIEVLERVQAQQDRLSNDPRAKIGNTISSTDNNAQQSQIAPQASALQSRQDTLEGLLEELTEGLAAEQSSSNSGDAEHVYPTISSSTAQPIRHLDEAPSSLKSTTAVPTTLSTPFYTSTTVTPVIPHQNINDSTVDQQSLFIGQLDSIGSDLGDSLTGDFYAFHEGSGQFNDLSTPSSASADESRKTEIDSIIGNSVQQVDLEPSAQTRNSVAQRGNFGPPTFQSNPVRFDFSQPISANINHIPQPNLIRASRQEPNILGITNSPISSTSNPFGNVDNYWRPANEIGDRPSLNNADLGQQYYHARQDTSNFGPQDSRFQNLNRAYSQPAVPENPAGYIPYSGHSLIASSDHQSPNSRLYASTQTPIISVVSGRDSGNGGSVSWDPPAPVSRPSNLQTTHDLPDRRYPHQTNNVNEPPPSYFFSPNEGTNFNNQPKQSQSHSNFIESQKLNNINESPQPVDPEIVPTTLPSRSRNTGPPTTIQWDRTTLSGQYPNIIKSASGNQPTLDRSETERTRFSTDSITTTFSPETTSAQMITTTPATTSSNLMSSTPASNNSTKKDDMVIYYYYYYDDNKNATVVAKNMSSTQGDNPIEASIDGDGGLEDTPYMDDPVPLAENKQRVSNQGGSSSTTIASTTVPSRSEITRPQTNQVVAQTHKIPQHQGTVDHDVLRHTNKFGPSQSDSRRLSTIENQSEGRRVVSESVSSPYPTSSGTDSASTHRTTFRDSKSNGDSDSRFKSTEAPISSSSPVPNRTTSRLDNYPNSPFTTPSNRLQLDLINNVLNGRAPSNKLPHSPKHSISTSTSTAQAINRNPQSNASRYGTSNNVVIDPLDIDPTAPVSLSQGQSSSIAHHHKSNLLTNQMTRKPVSTPPVDRQQSSGRHSPQKNSGHSNRVAANPSIPGVNHISEPKSSSAMSGIPQNKNQPNEAPPVNTTERTSERVIAPNKKPQTTVNHEQPTSSSPELVRVSQVQNQSQNLTSTQNPTSNGRSTVSSTLKPMNEPPSEVQLDRIVHNDATLSMRSTSVTKSFVTPNMVQITTSVSPPTISSTSTSSSITRSSTSTVNITPQTVPSTVAPVNRLNNVTENPDSSNNSTRRKFGNRNNRFQTRLNSISSQSSRSSTTTTTPSPLSTSTTRRPILSTTRKSSKQLFAGRRRLSSIQSTESSSSPPPNEEHTSNEASDRQEQSTASRLKTNSNTNISSSTAVPVQIDSSSTSSQRPNIFGAQRGGSRSRPSFMKTTKPSTTVLEESNNNQTDQPQTLGKADQNVDKFSTTDSHSSTEKNLVEAVSSSSEGSATGLADSRAPPTESDSLLRKATTTNSPVVESSSITNSSPSPSSEQEISESNNSRSKPRVRPLFASRQRNATLFGNRRHNNVTAT